MRHLHFILGVFSYFLLALQPVMAQVSGTITDDEANLLEYATAALYDQESGALITGVVTNVGGDFSIAEVKRGTYYLEASFIGYKSQTIKDIKVLNRNRPVDLGVIALDVGDNQLNEVVVQAERATVINKIDRQIFDATQFQNTQGGSATDILRNLPSVSVDGLGEISVRGSTGFVVLLNGNPVQGSGATLLNQLPANAIERVEVITAPSAKYDPEGKAGILNIITSKGAADGAYAQINVRGGFPSKNMKIQKLISAMELMQLITSLKENGIFHLEPVINAMIWAEGVKVMSLL